MGAEIDHLETGVKAKRGFFKHDIDRIPCADVKNEKGAVNLQEKLDKTADLENKTLKHKQRPERRGGEVKAEDSQHPQRGAVNRRLEANQLMLLLHLMNFIFKLCYSIYGTYHLSASVLRGVCDIDFKFDEGIPLPPDNFNPPSADFKDEKSTSSSSLEDYSCYFVSLAPKRKVYSSTAPPKNYGKIYGDAN